MTLSMPRVGITIIYLACAYAILPAGCTPDQRQIFSDMGIDMGFDSKKTNEQRYLERRFGPMLSKLDAAWKQYGHGLGLTWVRVRVRRDRTVELQQVISSESGGHGSGDVVTKALMNTLSAVQGDSTLATALSNEPSVEITFPLKEGKSSLEGFIYWREQKNRELYR